jgi:hypothetical protein
MVAALDLEEVVLGSAGMLEQLLAVADLAKYRATLPTQSVPVTLRGGKLDLETLRLMADRYAIDLQGSARFRKVVGPEGAERIAQTLDLVAEVPMTRELVGRFSDDAAVYELLKDEVLRVPVRGTADAPAIAQGVVRENVARLVRESLPGLARRKLKDLVEEEIGADAGNGAKKTDRPEEDEKKDVEEALEDAGRKAIERALEEIF